MSFKKMHIWPYEGTPHPVGKKHKKAPEGSKHWEGTEFVVGNEKLKQGK